MGQDALEGFARSLRSHPELRRLLNEARTPGEILDLAQQCGYSVSPAHLLKALSSNAPQR